MSTCWGFVCQSHDPELVSELWFNRGESKLRKLWADRVRLVSLLDDGYVDLDSDIARAAWWLSRHPNCRVAIRSEYGDTEPIEFAAGGVIPADTLR